MSSSSSESSLSSSESSLSSSESSSESSSSSESPIPTVYKFVKKAKSRSFTAKHQQKHPPTR